MKKTTVIIMTSITSFAFLAIMIAIFCFAKMQDYKKVAVQSLNNELKTLNKYDDMLDKHIDLQIEYLNTLEEYNDYIYINSGQAEADSIHEKI